MKPLRNFIGITALLVTSAWGASAQTSAIQRGMDAITVGTLKAQEDFLASHWMEGRYSTEKGAMLASDYIASMLGVYGIQPAGDGNSYFQTFNLIRYAHPTNERMEIAYGGNVAMPTPNVDYYIRSRRVQGSFRIDGQAVYAGYGLYLPQYGIDSYGKMDVRGKVLVVHPFTEEHLKNAVFGTKELSYQEKAKVLANTESEAKRRGAAAVIFVMSESEVGNTIPHLGKATSVAEDILGLPADTLSAQPLSFNVSRVYLRSALAGINVESAPANLNQKAVATKANIRIAGDASGEVCKVRNVVGVIKGQDTTRCVVVGAHYDHYGLWGSMLYPGADDNASGTVGVLTIAKAFKESGIKPKVSIVFGLWTCEEKGLWGSTYYTRNPYIPMASTMMYINYDMIGRSLPKDTLSREASFFYYDKDTTIKSETLKLNAQMGNPLSLRARPTTGGPGSRSDHGPFSMYKIPFMGWMTAWHTDYHQPTDTPDKIDYIKMQKVARIGFLTLLRYANLGVVNMDSGVVFKQEGR